MFNSLLPAGTYNKTKCQLVLLTQLTVTNFEVPVYKPTSKWSCINQIREINKSDFL